MGTHCYPCGDACRVPVGCGDITRVLKNTKSIGDLTEAMFLGIFLRNGYAVSVPWGDNLPYDLVIERDGKFDRVQCKTGRLFCGAVTFDAGRYTLRAGKIPHTESYIGQVDYFAVYCPELKTAYLVPIDSFVGFHISLKIDEKRARARGKNNLWAKDFLLC